MCKKDRDKVKIVTLTPSLDANETHKEKIENSKKRDGDIIRIDLYCHLLSVKNIF